MEEEQCRIDEVMEMKALRRVVGTYLHYPSSAEENVRRWERSYSRLPAKHKEFLSHLPEKYKEVRRCIAVNASLIQIMLRCFQPPFQLGEEENDSYDDEQDLHSQSHDHENGWKSRNADERSAKTNCTKRLAVENDGTKSAVGVQGSYETANTEGAANPSGRKEARGVPEWYESSYGADIRPSDDDKIRCVLRNIVRDWTTEGSVEREMCYKPLLSELQNCFPKIDSEARPTCLVPGAGLGRLALEISRLGFICQGNEFSYYMLICSSFILNNTMEAEEFTIHPWIHTNCNRVSDKDQLQAVSFPDLHPGSAGITEGFSMCAGDFVEVYGHSSQTGAWDVVVTCFFIDTAHNIVQYIEIISKILKPGGVWLNLGPLLYHFADFPFEDDMSVELSLEDVKKVARSYGFKLKKESTIETTFTSCPTSMLQNKYQSAFWTMVKE